MKKQILIILLIVSIVYFYNKIKETHKSLFLGNGLNIAKIESNVPNSIPPCNIMTPILDNKFTYSFWLYIKDFYHNTNCKCWKHIFHKGTKLNSNDILTFKYDDWNRLTNEITEQSIGLWLDPNQNNLRVVVNTESNSVFNLKYVEIKNIPIRELFNITILVNKNFLEIYIDGNLYRSKQFKNNIIFNNKDLFFNHQNTYSGAIYDFIYLPKTITFNDIRYLYNNKPTLTE